jgi:hypothetical protein
VHASFEFEDSDLAVSTHQLTERQFDGLALRRGPGDALSLGHQLVIDVDIRPHTHDATPADVYGCIPSQSLEIQRLVIAGAISGIHID